MKTILLNRLKRLRFDDNHLSQDDLAKAVGVSRQTINSIENGKYNPSVKLAMEIASYFKCSVEDIFYLEEQK